MWSAVSVAWIRSGALGDARRRRGHGPSGPSPLCWQHCCGGGLLPSPGPMSAPAWGTPACAVLAMCTNKPPRPESLVSPWALGVQVGQSDTSGCPQLGHRTSCPSLVMRCGAQEAEPEGTWKVIWSHPNFAGKLRALRRESGAIWRCNQGPQAPPLEPFPLQRQTQKPLSPLQQGASGRSESPLCLLLWAY